MDEKPYPFLGENREPVPMCQGDTQKIDSEYTRKGTCSIFVFTKVLAGIMLVLKNIEPQLDWAEKICYRLEECYPNKEKVIH